MYDPLELKVADSTVHWMGAWGWSPLASIIQERDFVEEKEGSLGSRLDESKRLGVGI